MKKLVAAAFMFCIIGGSQIIHAEEVEYTDNVEALLSLTPYEFKNYPPSTYNGKTLVKVEKLSDRYRGWYI